MSRRAREITGRTVLLSLVAFFGVVFAVNGVFFWFASDSWTGLSTEDAYRKGIAFNDQLARADAQKRLGWTAETDYASAGPGAAATWPTLPRRRRANGTSALKSAARARSRISSRRAYGRSSDPPAQRGQPRRFARHV